MLETRHKKKVLKDVMFALFQTNQQNYTAGVVETQKVQLYFLKRDLCSFDIYKFSEFSSQI